MPVNNIFNGYYSLKYEIISNVDALFKLEIDCIGLEIGGIVRKNRNHNYWEERQYVSHQFCFVSVNYALSLCSVFSSCL